MILSIDLHGCLLIGRQTTPFKWAPHGRHQICAEIQWRHWELLCKQKQKLSLQWINSSKFGDSWIGHPIGAEKKIQQTVRATTIPRLPLENSRQREFRSSGFHFLWSFFDLFFLKQVKTWPEQKYTRQILIRLVVYSSAEVSDRSEVPRINGKLFF